MAHAKLGIAEDNSGKLVSTVRQQARLLAEKEGKDLILIDGPPGIGCPVIAAITGVDLVLAITEPTLSGIHDLKRVLGVAQHFTIPSVVCINKFDINLDNTREIETFCQSKDIEIVGKLPYDRSVTQAMVRAQSIMEHPCGDVSHETGRMWRRIANRLEGGACRNHINEGVRA
jgi:MinD superfamily P-loop ATPase